MSAKIIYQPAEERPGGAKAMIAAVVLQNRNMESTIGYFAPYSPIIAGLTIYLTLTWPRKAPRRSWTGGKL
ncbi:MAG: amidohydrolase [Microcystis aeruginosa LG13-11]|nr:amidohydrolase [Microcystis aeruginosa LG13-11]